MLSDAQEGVKCVLQSLQLRAVREGRDARLFFVSQIPPSLGCMASL